MQLVPTQARGTRPGSADVGGDLRLTSQPAPPPLPSAFPPAPTRADDRSRGQRCRTLKCAATAAARPHDRTLSGMPAAHTITPQLAMRSSRRTNEPAEAGPIGRRALARGRRGSGARGHGARSVRRPRSPSAAQPARRIITRPSEATAGTRRSGAGTGAEYLRVRIDGTVRRRQNLDLAMTAPQRTLSVCVCARACACVLRQCRSWATALRTFSRLAGGVDADAGALSCAPLRRNSLRFLLWVQHADECDHPAMRSTLDAAWCIAIACTELPATTAGTAGTSVCAPAVHPCWVDGVGPRRARRDGRPRDPV